MKRPPLVPEVSLHLAGDVMGLWQRLVEARLVPEECFPYWAVGWVGGQAVARYLLDHPAEVAGKRILDFATGSGLCAIAAIKAGAAQAMAADVDIISREATRLNAQVNQVELSICDRELTGSEPPHVDVILAGDVCYEREMTDRVLPWLRAAWDRGTRVLLGDPGREYFPRHGVRCLARYEIPTAWEVEGADCKQAGVYAFGG